MNSGEHFFCSVIVYLPPSRGKKKNVHLKTGTSTGMNRKSSSSWEADLIYLSGLAPHELYSSLCLWAAGQGRVSYLISYESQYFYYYINILYKITKFCTH